MTLSRLLTTRNDEKKDSLLLGLPPELSTYLLGFLNPISLENLKNIVLTCKFFSSTRINVDSKYDISPLQPLWQSVFSRHFQYEYAECQNLNLDFPDYKSLYQQNVIPFFYHTKLTASPTVLNKNAMLPIHFIMTGKNLTHWKIAEEQNIDNENSVNEQDIIRKQLFLRLLCVSFLDKFNRNAIDWAIQENDQISLDYIFQTYWQLQGMIEKLPFPARGEVKSNFHLQRESYALPVKYFIDSKQIYLWDKFKNPDRYLRFFTDTIWHWAAQCNQISFFKRYFDKTGRETSNFVAAMEGDPYDHSLFQFKEFAYYHTPVSAAALEDHQELFNLMLEKFVFENNEQEKKVLISALYAAILGRNRAIIDALFIKKTMLKNYILADENSIRFILSALVYLSLAPLSEKTQAIFHYLLKEIPLIDLGEDKETRLSELLNNHIQLYQFLLSASAFNELDIKFKLILLTLQVSLKNKSFQFFAQISTTPIFQEIFSQGKNQDYLGEISNEFSEIYSQWIETMSGAFTISSTSVKEKMKEQLGELKKLPYFPLRFIFPKSATIRLLQTLVKNKITKLTNLDFNKQEVILFNIEEISVLIKSLEHLFDENYDAHADCAYQAKHLVNQIYTCIYFPFFELIEESFLGALKLDSTDKSTSQERAEKQIKKFEEWIKWITFFMEHDLLPKNILIQALGEVLKGLVVNIEDYDFKIFERLVSFMQEHQANFNQIVREYNNDSAEYSPLTYLMWNSDGINYKCLNHLLHVGIRMAPFSLTTGTTHYSFDLSNDDIMGFSGFFCRSSNRVENIKEVTLQNYLTYNKEIISFQFDNVHPELIKLRINDDVLAGLTWLLFVIHADDDYEFEFDYDHKFNTDDSSCLIEIAINSLITHISENPHANLDELIATWEEEEFNSWVFTDENDDGRENKMEIRQAITELITQANKCFAKYQKRYFPLEKLVEDNNSSDNMDLESDFATDTHVNNSSFKLFSSRLLGKRDHSMIEQNTEESSTSNECDELSLLPQTKKIRGNR